MCLSGILAVSTNVAPEALAEPINTPVFNHQLERSVS
jgi:hypothetical protein